MSEKKDGFRAIWTGSEFISRQGLVFDAPEWFKAGMPTAMLDGEIWPGRSKFNFIQAMMRDGWEGLTFQVFDAPEIVAPFRRRLAYLKTLALPPHAELVAHVRCRDTKHLIEAADALVAAGGEGMVVRDPRAMYQAGRTHDVLRWVPQCPRLNRRRVA